MKEYSSRKRINESLKENDLTAKGRTESIPNSAMEAIMAGRAHADAGMMGHREDLAPSLAAKMSKAFGMDLTGMQLYRSEAMQGTGTKGLAAGNRVVLSADIDLNTTEGQAVLGHEISHVHAQSRGIGMGNSGLYQNSGLEHQADVEGMRAAHGQSILGESSGMDTGSGMAGLSGLTPIGAGMSASAGAPMQAKKAKDDNFSAGLGERLGCKTGYLSKSVLRGKSDSAFEGAPAGYVNQCYLQAGKTARYMRHKAYKDQFFDTFKRLSAYGLKSKKRYQKDAAMGKNEIYNEEQRLNAVDVDDELELDPEVLHDEEMEKLKRLTKAATEEKDLAAMDNNVNPGQELEDKDRK